MANLQLMSFIRDKQKANRKDEYLKSRHDPRRGHSPNFVQMTSSDESVAGPHDVVLADEEADNSVEVRPVPVGRLVHVGWRLQRLIKIIKIGC